ncbi:hypothetical protein ACVW1A_007104 [Bradyrhizobium sp. LB1.3]
MKLQGQVKRSVFFWGIIGASFVGYAASYSHKRDLIPLLISCFGLFSSVAWTLQNRGSKYWQEAWEQKVKAVEVDVLGTNLFSNWEPLLKKGPWGAAMFSVSSLAIAISDFSVLIWIILLIKALPQWGGPVANWAALIVLITISCILACFTALTRTRQN